jgi:excisionase family DNA binding protein
MPRLTLSDYITTKEASERLGVTQHHVRHLVVNNIVQGVKLGHDWLVSVVSLEHYIKNRPKPGPKPEKKAH